MACQASDNPYLAPLVTLAIETAMRRGELLGLDWDDLRLEQNYVHLALTKNGTSRDVPLSPKARQTIEALLRSISGRVIVHPEALRPWGPEGPMAPGNPKSRHNRSSVP